MFRSTSSTRSVDWSFRASSGRTCSSAAASTAPTSATVSATVFLSRLKSARWTSRTALRNRPVNARPPTTSEATDSMIGRAAIRSAWFFRMTSSVSFCAIRERTLSSRSAAVARLANWSEFTAACLAYAVTSASTIASEARTTSTLAAS